MKVKKRGWSEWFVYDLKKIKSATRRMIKHRFFRVLTPPQKANLYETCVDVVDALEEVKAKVKR